MLVQCDASPRGGGAKGQRSREGTLSFLSTFWLRFLFLKQDEKLWRSITTFYFYLNAASVPVESLQISSL